jgi:hypothetical protein
MGTRDINQQCVGPATDSGCISWCKGLAVKYRFRDGQAKTSFVPPGGPCVCGGEQDPCTIPLPPIASVRIK